MPKKGNLATELKKSAGSSPANDISPVQETKVEAPRKKNPHHRPSREGQKCIAGYFDEAVSKQLKHIGVDEGKTVQDMLAEALNLFFEAHGKKPIA